jgi:hypothetical protein
MPLCLSAIIKNDPLVKLKFIELLLQKNEPMAIGNLIEKPDSIDSNFLLVGIEWKPTPSKCATLDEMSMLDKLRAYKDDPDIEFLWNSPMSTVLCTATI